MREDTEVGAAAARRLAEGVPLREAFDVHDPTVWIALDEEVRTVHWVTPGGRAEWERRIALTDDVRTLDEPGLALALCHRDGRIREKAIGPAVRYDGLRPLIAVRCTDWAAPVREEARAVLSDVRDMDEAVSLVPLMLLLGRRRRGAFGVELLTEVLRRASREQLAPLLRSSDRAVRRFAYRLAVERGLLSPEDLAGTAARDGDAVLQNLCAEAAIATVQAGRGAEVLETLLAARNPRARSAGVTALRRAARIADAEPFLADRSGLVRACARYVVRQGGIEPLPVYRAWCARPGRDPIRPGALLGLAECGSRADAGLLRPLLTHPRAAVRARAVAGLRLLDMAETDVLRPLLDDPAPGVVREVTLALLPSAEALPVDWLMQRLAPERPRQVRVAAFRLLQGRGGKVRLRAAVGLLHDTDDRLRAWAEQCVQRWHPTEDVQHGDPEVGRLLDRSAHLFGDYAQRRRKREAGLAG